MFFSRPESRGCLGEWVRYCKDFQNPSVPVTIGAD